MSEEDNLQKAINLLTRGRRTEAATELLRLEKTISDKNLRLQLIGAAMSAWDPIKYNEKLIQVSGEGVKITQEFGRKDLQANFMSRRAEFVMSKVSLLHYHRGNLKLAPGWIEFSTEAEKEKHSELSQEIDKLEGEVNELLTRALELAKESGSKEALGTALMSKGAVESARYINYKMEYMVGSRSAKPWLKFSFLRYPLLEQLFIFPGSKGGKLQSLVDSFTEDYLKAAEIFEELNDSTSGYAYHNLANHLRIAFRFGAARKYLEMASNSAKKYNDPLLKHQIEMLKKEIDTKNRNIPDYIHGESREL